MVSANKFALYLTGIETILSILYIFFSNKLDERLFDYYFENVDSSDRYNVFWTAYRFSFLLLQILFIVAFTLAIWRLQKRGSWIERESSGLIFKNKQLIAKVFGAIFMAHYFWYFLSDIAYSIDITTLDTQYTYSSKLVDLNLFANSTRFEVDHISDKTGWAILLMFISDILSALLYAFTHFLVIVLFEYYFSDNQKNGNLYPLS